MLFMPFGIAFPRAHECDPWRIADAGDGAADFRFLLSSKSRRRARRARRNGLPLVDVDSNLLSVAIYCNDARAGVLMLLDGSTGQESDGTRLERICSGSGAC